MINSDDIVGIDFLAPHGANAAIDRYNALLHQFFGESARISQTSEFQEGIQFDKRRVDGNRQMFFFHGSASFLGNTVIFASFPPTFQNLWKVGIYFKR